MAGYDYNYRSGYSTGNGAGSYTHEWGKPRHSSSPDYGYGADDQWRRPSSPPRQVIDEYSPRVQTEVFRDNSRIAPFNNGTNWCQQPHPYNGTSGYGDYTDYSNNTVYKPNGHSSIRNDNYDDYNRKSGSHTGPFNMASNGSGHRAKPNRLAPFVGALPVRGDGRLSIPTDDMERALHYLKESSKTSSWPR